MEVFARSWLYVCALVNYSTAAWAQDRKPRSTDDAEWGVSITLQTWAYGTQASLLSNGLPNPDNVVLKLSRSQYLSASSIHDRHGLCAMPARANQALEFGPFERIWRWIGKLITLLVRLADAFRDSCPARCLCLYRRASSS